MNDDEKKVTESQEQEVHHGYDDEYYQHDLSGLMEG